MTNHQLDERRVSELNAEIERLRGALERISNLPKWVSQPHDAANWAIDIARAALEHRP